MHQKDHGKDCADSRKGIEGNIGTAEKIGCDPGKHGIDQTADGIHHLCTLRKK